jgi:hypothetical protein
MFMVDRIGALNRFECARSCHSFDECTMTREAARGFIVMSSADRHSRHDAVRCCDTRALVDE